MTILVYLFLFCPYLVAEVDPPNYDFSLDSLAVFYPGQDLAKMQELHGEGEVIEEQKGIKTTKFYVAHIRYKFPVFVQIDKEDKSIDFFARLPSYFLHDVFHQSLINRYGQQQKYYRLENNAVYKWTEQEKFTLIYSGSCTITCFPIYLAGTPKDGPAGHKSLIEKMQGPPKKP